MELSKKFIYNELVSMSDEKYRKFSSSLLPNVDNILGVRLPMLRKLAKEIAKQNFSFYLNIKNTHNGSDNCFEETMLEGMVIGYIKADIDTVLKYVALFVPKIDNWSVCDSFCTGLKITKNNMEKVWNFLATYFTSDKEYYVRFAVVMALTFFINEQYFDNVLNVLNSLNCDKYYAKMAVAWAISKCYVFSSERTALFLKNCNLDDFTFNKSIQKINESFLISDSGKETARSVSRL